MRAVAVSVLGRSRAEEVTTALTTRLRDGDAAVREVAALGLGITEPTTAVAPLIGVLRDASAGVRANAAWAGDSITFSFLKRSSRASRMSSSTMQCWARTIARWNW